MTMTDYNDRQAEDAWDDGDPVDAKLRVLRRAADEITSPGAFSIRRRADLLRLVRKLEREGIASAELARIRARLEGAS